MTTAEDLDAEAAKRGHAAHKNRLAFIEDLDRPAKTAVRVVHGRTPSTSTVCSICTHTYMQGHDERRNAYILVPSLPFFFYLGKRVSCTLVSVLE